MIYKVDSINRTVYAGEGKGLTAVISTPVLGSRRDEPQTMRFINGAGYINSNATDDINENGTDNAVVGRASCTGANGDNYVCADPCLK
ncbi:hypothetical protein [Yersinia pseudotuberculosis]|uniref:hypothetical protein n=1 Tax=Yersinia pseudotuberculosis TaxID=633 RepID=UPI0005DDF85D|nr:hypothetical protein [Yersinia pseudotuberculosis]CNC31098.1 Uncharacterised protein [Yersinia pseudotuberculosis]